MISLHLEDNEFENKGITHDRVIARAFVLDENNKFVMLKVKRDDEFGKAEYLETSGGGVDMGETPEEAVLRELDEELGVKAEIITKLGIVDDYYNEIKRHNINHYFLVKIVGYTKIHHVSAGDNLIEDIIHVNPTYIYNEYKNNRNTKIARLVYNREEPIFKEAFRYLYDIKNPSISKGIILSIINYLLILAYYIYYPIFLNVHRYLELGIFRPIFYNMLIFIFIYLVWDKIYITYINKYNKSSILKITTVFLELFMIPYTLWIGMFIANAIK